MKPRGRRHLYALDLTAALALTAVYVSFVRLTADDGQPAYTGPFWLGCLVAAAIGLPVAVRGAVGVAGLVLLVIGGAWFAGFTVRGAGKRSGAGAATWLPQRP